MAGDAAAGQPGNESARRLGRLANAASSLGLGLSGATLQRLMDYLGLLQRWNKVYNLTALRDPDEMLSHHLVDSLAALPALRRQLASLGDGPVRILDVGSGGGLPGVVLAVVQPDWQVSCVDTVAKKSSFIRQVAAELRLGNLQGLHARVENLDPDDGRYGVITSRAFASLADFAALSQHLLADHGVWMAMKGRDTQDEQDQLPPGVQVFHVEQLQVPGLDAHRCLVWMRRTPS
jgi:16S rRNA (guanine527-N7)-methyltransferase